MKGWENKVLEIIYKEDCFSTVNIVSLVSENDVNAFINESIKINSFPFGKNQIVAEKGLLKLSELVKTSLSLNKKTDDLFQSIRKVDEILEEQDFFLEEFRLSPEKGASFLDVFVFANLSRCPIWPKIHKDSLSKGHQLIGLMKWYQNFLDSYLSSIEYTFDPSILSDKHKRTFDKIIVQKKTNPSLIEATRRKNYEMVVELLKQGASVEAVNEVDLARSAHIACEYGDLKMCEILDSFGCDWSSEDAEKMTPIFYAIKSGLTETVDFLLGKKVNMEHVEFQDRTPFYWACCTESIKMIDHLYKIGCDINRQSKLGRTALSKACYLGKFEVVQYLLRLPEININLLDNKGRSALHNASWGPKGGREGKKIGGTWIYDSPESAQALLEKGIDVNLKDIEGNSPLSIACSSEAISTIPVLIAFGADLHSRNNLEETPLWVASRFGHVSTINLLVEVYQVKPGSRNKDSLNEMEATLKYEQREAYVYYLDREVSIDAVDELEKILRIVDSKIHQFIDLLLKKVEEKNLKLIFKQALLPFMKKITDPDIFKRILKFWIQTGLTQLETELLLNTAFEINRIDFMENIRALLNNKDVEFPCAKIYQMLNEKMIEDKFVNYLIRYWNINIFNYKDSSRGETILHLFVNQRRVKAILDIFDIFAHRESEQSQKVTNKYLRQVLESPNMNDLLRDFILERDASELNCIELAMLKKYMDVFTIVEEQLNKQLNISQNPEIKSSVGKSFCIPEYEILQEQLESVKPLRTHSKKDVLDKLIQESLPSNGSQYNVKLNQEENTFFEELESIDDKPDLMLNLIKSKTEGFFYAKTEPELNEIAKELSRYKVFGVDLEYFTDSKDCNTGFICTLQISTVSRNYVIDSLFLRKEISGHPILKELFESANYLKIFHGADTDIKWLKADYDFNLVNLFDTAIASMINQGAKSLNALGTLCKQLLDLTMDKGFQTSDWRIRPLPRSMLEYSKLDSAILIFVYRKLEKDLRLKGKRGELASFCNKGCFKKVETSAFKKIRLAFK